ncbi:MAG TPA: hypothetical protein VG323_09315 [Thermoanaerobaculia bacterium]|nr:hypothetical protein [Thermoanaerobaculia bacterium]
MNRRLSRIVAVASLGALLAVPMAAAPAPPTIDAPLFDCVDAVFVRAYDSGATVRVYVDGTLRGTKTGATSYGTWVNLSAALAGNQAVQATQEIGGVESPRSTALIVAAPNPPSPMHFELPVEACAKGGYVHNILAGNISIKSSAGDQIAAEANNNGDFPTFYSRALVGGESLKVTVSHCRLGSQTSAPQPVSQIYSGREQKGKLPTPLIDSATAIECQTIVFVRDLIPGVTVKVFNGATTLGQAISTSDGAWVSLSAPMDPAWQLRAQQELCAGIVSDKSPIVQPTPLSALGPPIVEGPIWEGQQHVLLDVPIAAPTTLTVDGTAVRKDIDITGHEQLNVDKPFVAGQTVSAFYRVCGKDSPPAQPIVVIAPPKTLPPPRVGLPLFACTNGVSVSGVVEQAEVVILIDGHEVFSGVASSGTASFTIGPTLQAGQNVTAFQRIGPIKSDPSPPVVVFAAPDLQKPTIKPLKACQRSVVVENVLPGAWVTLFVNNAAFAATTAFGTSVQIATPPLTQGWSVTARQELNVCRKSALSDAVTVGAPPRDQLKIKPQIVEPVRACQTTFEVRSLVPDTELDVFVNGAWKKRVPVTAEDILISMQPPFLEGQKLRVRPTACGVSSELFDEVVVQPPKIDPPTLVQPIFNGDPSVVVTGAPSSSLVRIYNASHDVVGAGMGGPLEVTIYLSKPAQTGDKLTATASLCGKESGASVVAEVQANRSPRPHDAMVRWFWLDGSNKAQALLQVAGRNVYKGSVIQIDGKAYPTYPIAQLVPAFGRDNSTLGTPVDVIGSVGMLLYADKNGNRFAAAQQLKLSILNPNGTSKSMQRFNEAVGSLTDRYDLASSMATLDSDGDGIPDVKESPGATPDLSVLGANPLRKNIFVEVDWMVASDHTHEPSVQSFDRIRNSFASALVLNPDGSRGVDLFVDMGQNGGQGGEHLAHFNTIAFSNTDAPDVLYSQFYNNNFAANRKGLFHYCVFGHQQPGTTSSGVAHFVSDQLIVTLINSGDVNDSDWITDVAGTFMHELGHNLNLRHGGDTDTNRKPNYPSIMSYLYQFPGISTNCDTGSDGVYDYSYGLYADLDETNLDERKGICDGVAQDWNGSGGSGQTGVRANINGDKVKDYAGMLNADLFNEFVDAMTSTTNRPLHDFCDWCFWTALGLP